MKRVLMFIILIIVMYMAMFHINKKSINYVTMTFYMMSLISALSNLLIRYA